ncbi:Uu.00g092350.m01.CDS01 [Anthostomella pinea]|uniref:Uu.00g092350.m01.CDS01 n=1 Tax=Anthostomella pinea TaxID=933095 RepID=A0AAI8VN82_9PEZI|nr:Uu.00g092350.m01.CDS01 [Anthostomella pinea]
MHVTSFTSLAVVLGCLAGMGLAAATEGDQAPTAIFEHNWLGELTEISTGATVKNRKRAIKLSDGPISKCTDYPKGFGPPPTVEDCKAVVEQFKAQTGDITVKLVEGCVFKTSGTCTGSVCPQKLGQSTIPPATAAQFMASPVLDCIANGQRGWWIDGKNWGVGVYLT